MIRFQIVLYQSRYTVLLYDSANHRHLIRQIPIYFVISGRKFFSHDLWKRVEFARIRLDPKLLPLCVIIWIRMPAVQPERYFFISPVSIVCFQQAERRDNVNKRGGPRRLRYCATRSLLLPNRA
jgi:hypothetical protein